MNNRFTPLIKLALGGFAMSVASLIIWMSVNEGHDGFAIGAITEIREDSIMVADRYEAETIVTFTDTTSIFRKRDALDFEDLKQGDFVQVKGTPIGEKTIEADTIILLRPPENHKNTQ